MEHFIVRNISDDHYKTRTGLSWTTINSVIYVRISSGFGQIQLFYGLRFFCSPTKKKVFTTRYFRVRLGIKIDEGPIVREPTQEL